VEIIHLEDIVERTKFKVPHGSDLARKPKRTPQESAELKAIGDLKAKGFVTNSCCSRKLLLVSPEDAFPPDFSCGPAAQFSSYHLLSLLLGKPEACDMNMFRMALSLFAGTVTKHAASSRSWTPTRLITTSWWPSFLGSAPTGNRAPF
jgi:hypothetical protein